MTTTVAPDRKEARQKFTAAALLTRLEEKIRLADIAEGEVNRANDAAFKTLADRIRADALAEEDYSIEERLADRRRAEEAGFLRLDAQTHRVFLESLRSQFEYAAREERNAIRDNFLSSHRS